VVVLPTLERAVEKSIASAVMGALAAVRTADAKVALRWLSAHTGLPALLLAAVLVCVGYRLLKRTTRFALEVAAVALVLAFASELGWIRW
jgi:hypothetical protein